MIRHAVFARHDRRAGSVRLDIPLIKRSVRAALSAEGIFVPCEVGVLITDDVGIRALNREFRGVDAATDVLSFPATAQIPGRFEAQDRDFSAETGRFPLGDIAISAERVTAQAKEYRTGVGRETSYLTVHSVLHLLGYDHIDGGEQKALMRSREETICRTIKVQ
jgi:probable rRNA maturation factor